MTTRTIFRRTAQVTATVAALVALSGCFPLNYVAWGVASEIDAAARKARAAKLEKLPDVHVAFHLDDGSTVMGRWRKSEYGAFEDIHKLLQGQTKRIIDARVTERTFGGVFYWSLSHENNEGVTVPLTRSLISTWEGKVHDVELDKPVDMSKVCLQMRPVSAEQKPTSRLVCEPLDLSTLLPSATSATPQAPASAPASSVRHKIRCWGECKRLPVRGPSGDLTISEP